MLNPTMGPNTSMPDPEAELKKRADLIEARTKVLASAQRIENLVGDGFYDRAQIEAARFITLPRVTLPEKVDPRSIRIAIQGLDMVIGSLDVELALKTMCADLVAHIASTT